MTNKPQEITSKEYRKLKTPKAKYNNKKVEYHGFIFDSQKECDRYKELKILEAIGDICNLLLQVRYELIPSCSKQDGMPAQKAVYYIADFVYREGIHKTVIEDCKGFKTPIYKLKKKIMRSKGYIVRES